MRVAIGAVGKEGEGCGHAEPAQSADELANLQIEREKIPLAEEEGPVTDFGIDEREGAGAGVLHVGADIEEVLEKPESGESEAISLAMEIKVDGAEEWNEKLAERAAEKHEGVAAPGKEEMAGFVDHEIDEVGKEEAGGVTDAWRRKRT